MQAEFKHGVGNINASAGRIAAGHAKNGKANILYLFVKHRPEHALGPLGGIANAERSSIGAGRNNRKNSFFNRLRFAQAPGQRLPAHNARFLIRLPVFPRQAADNPKLQGQLPQFLRDETAAFEQGGMGLQRRRKTLYPLSYQVMPH